MKVGQHQAHELAEVEAAHQLLQGLPSRVDAGSVQPNVPHGPQVLQLAVVPEGPPLGVDEHQARAVLEGHDVLCPLHVARVRARAKDDACNILLIARDPVTKTLRLFLEMKTWGKT